MTGRFFLCAPTIKLQYPFLNQRACLIRPRMDLPETDVAANLLGMIVKGKGKAGHPVCIRVGDYSFSTVFPSRYR